MISNDASLALWSTGDPGFDGILGGGIPDRSVVVIAGEPGTGKTILTLQMLFHAARQGKKCLYLTTLSEPALKLMRYMQLFDFFDAALLERQVVFADLGVSIREGAERALSAIEARIEEEEPDFVAIDSFRAIAELLGQGESTRPFIYDLAVHTSGWGATTLLVGEYTRQEHMAFPEFAVADGIIQLTNEHQDLTAIRQMEVTKLRGAAYSTGRHFFDIGPSGVTFYPRVRAPSAVDMVPASSGSARVALGVEGLDDLLGGGVPRGSTTVTQGGTGVGKTLLGLQFLVEGTRRGERGILFSLEETPDQIRSVARSLGWDLPALEAEGKLVIRYASPVELSTDRFLHQARSEVRELGAKRAVFDSLTTMALGIPSERRYKEMVYAIAKYMRTEGVTLFMNVESPQLLGTAQLSGLGVSFLADNLIQLRYVELDGRLERAISVLKARGIAHSSELRAFNVDASGLHVVKGRYDDLRGVLTGLPSRDPVTPRLRGPETGGGTTAPSTARTLSEIAFALESAEDAPSRVDHVLGLARELIPSRRIALLETPPGVEPKLVVVPEASPEELDALFAILRRLHRLVMHPEESLPSVESLPHMTLPLVGLDEVIGLLRVEPLEEVVHDAEHLRLLSIVAAQLASYLTMINLRAAEAQSARDLKAAHDFQQLLVGVVSHDLRNPLSVITVAASLLDASEGPARAKLVERIARNTARATRIIDDLMDVTQLRATGSMVLSRKDVDLGALVEEMLEELRLAHPQQDLRFVAPVRGATTGSWDADRLAQVVSNLVNNAVIHGARNAPVVVRVSPREDDIVLSVHNEGPAIASALLPTLFDPFKQGRPSGGRASRSGLGLGLYIVDRIVRSHGGTVDVSSAEEGTTLTVTLPRSSPPS